MIKKWFKNRKELKIQKKLNNVMDKYKKVEHSSGIYYINIIYGCHYDDWYDGYLYDEFGNLLSNSKFGTLISKIEIIEQMINEYIELKARKDIINHENLCYNNSGLINLKKSINHEFNEI